VATAAVQCCYRVRLLQPGCSVAASDPAHGEGPAGWPGPMGVWT